MGVVKNNLILDMESAECDYDDCAADMLGAIKLQQTLEKNFFDRHFDNLVNILRRFACK